MEAGDTYQKFSKTGKWNGRGDFEIRFTGEVLIYGLAMFSDAVADAIIKLETDFEQTSEYIKLLATKEYVDDETGKVYTKYDGELKVTAEQISAINTRVDNINDRINTAGWITSADSVNIFAQELDKTGIKTSVANLEVKYNEISSAVSDNEYDIGVAKGLAQDAADEAAHALLTGIYGQEQYSQASNPWNGWTSGTEYKHVGALWYNPDTKETKRYTGTGGANTWEAVSGSAVSATSYVLQNKDKWSLVVANFDVQGNPTEASGIVTTAYGNTLYAKKDGIISAINQTPETISIEASRISLEGTVTANGNFKILLDGSVEGNNAKFTNGSFVNGEFSGTLNVENPVNSNVLTIAYAQRVVVNGTDVKAYDYVTGEPASFLGQWGYSNVDGLITVYPNAEPNNPPRRQVVPDSLWDAEQYGQQIPVCFSAGEFLPLSHNVPLGVPDI